MQNGNVQNVTEPDFQKELFLVFKLFFFKFESHASINILEISNWLFSALLFEKKYIM